MLSRFSVKKPYTVLVGVILAIILGVVSLTHMTADLLPSMNMPYAVVYTLSLIHIYEEEPAGLLCFFDGGRNVHLIWQLCSLRVRMRDF